MKHDTLPAGKYWIGDPCYVMQKHDVWLKFIHANNDDLFQFDKRFVFMAGTHSGDGMYYDKERTKYGVDAGVIGVIPMALVRKYSKDGLKTTLGRFVTFDEPFEVYRDGSCTFHIGDIEIVTDGSDEEEHECTCW